MDRIDRKIVELLQSDGRMSNKALADEIGLAPSSTLTRVRELERRGVITGYRATVDLAKVGRGLQAVVFVRLRPKNDKVVNDFVEQVWSIPETIAVHLVSGGDDVIVHLAVASTTELRETVLHRISNLPGVIDERTALVFEHRTRH